MEKLRGGYDFIRVLFDEIIVPPRVLEELAHSLFDPASLYLHHYNIVDLITVQKTSGVQKEFTSARLHEAEIQAMSLALEQDLPLLIEETEGRRVAQELGLHISGIAGQILRAFREDFIDKSFAQRLLRELLEAGRINKKIYDSLDEALQTNSF